MMTNRSKTLYVGVTNNLERRVFEHRNKLVEGFTKKYNMTRLVYFEETSDVYTAIAREKQIKGWLRIKKLALINSANPEWKNLNLSYFKNASLDSSHPSGAQNDNRSNPCRL